VHYRRRAIVPLIVIVAVVAAVPTILGVIDPALVNRFSVAALGSGSDTSLNSRVHLLDTSQGSIFGFGGGPGASDRGSKVTDNGYLAEFIDFGTVGGVLLILLLLAALVAAVRYALRSGSATRAVPLAIVLVYVLAEASAPVVQGQQGLIFWVVLALLGADLGHRHRGGPGALELAPADRPAEVASAPPVPALQP
jgi:O-antigen ligase